MKGFNLNIISNMSSIYPDIFSIEENVQQE